MNFNTIFYKSFRILLFPISVVYGVVVMVRNWLYDKNILKSVPFNFPLISIGNIAAGGTGKSPMAEYILALLHEQYKIATVSRGYKRKTKGYVLADENTTALEIGDEPMQFHIKYPEVPVAVGEERLVAIPQLLHDHPDLDVIILDDAFQHRSIKPGMNIILTEYKDLYVHDYFLPTGDLRDSRAAAKRADIIIVTKCPQNLGEDEAEEIRKALHPLEHQQLFFCSMNYGIPYHITKQTPYPLHKQEEILLVCGIANPKPLKHYLQEQVHTYYQKTYSDHHIFLIDDLNDIKKRLSQIQAVEKRIITTEKDRVRLLKFNESLDELPIYVIPVKHTFLFGASQVFEASIIQYIKKYKKTNE